MSVLTSIGTSGPFNRFLLHFVPLFLQPNTVETSPMPNVVIPQEPIGTTHARSAAETSINPKDSAEITDESAIKISSIVEKEVQHMLERFRAKLDADIEESRAFGETAPTVEVVENCLNLAGRIAPHITVEPKMKTGVFAENDGGISLVLQSLATDRRLTLKIPKTGSTVSVIRLNERMEARIGSLSLNNFESAREFADWVMTRQ